MSREYQISVNFANDLEVFQWIKDICFEDGKKVRNQNALIIGILDAEKRRQKILKEKT